MMIYCKSKYMKGEILIFWTMCGKKIGFKIYYQEVWKTGCKICLCIWMVKGSLLWLQSWVWKNQGFEESGFWSTQTRIFSIFLISFFLNLYTLPASFHKIPSIQFFPMWKQSRQSTENYWVTWRHKDLVMPFWPWHHSSNFIVPMLTTLLKHSLNCRWVILLGTTSHFS